MVVEMSAELAYILGFLWADGYLYEHIGVSKYFSKKQNKIIEYQSNYHSIQLDIVKKDMDLIKEVAYKSGIPWGSCYNRTRNHWQEQTNLSCSNIDWLNYLKYFDYKEKLCPNKIINSIPENLKKYWFRGISDGDGCFYIGSEVYQYSIASNYNDNMEYLQSLLTNLNIKFKLEKKVSNKGHKHSAIRLTSKKACYDFGNYIYSDYELDKIGLPRKYEIYKKICIEIEHPTIPGAKKWKLINVSGEEFVLYGGLENFCKEKNISISMLKNNIGNYIMISKYQADIYKNTIGWMLEEIKIG
jgi:hypothetical protein